MQSTRVLLIFILVNLSLSLNIQAGELPNITFAKAQWQLPNRGSIKGGILRITGNEKIYLIAQCTVPVALPKRGRFYFICEIKLSNVVFGDKLFKSPKLKIYDFDGQKYYRHTAKNLRVSPADFGVWRTYILEYKVSKSMKVKELRFEISMQQCLGTLEARNPRLAFTLPFDESTVTPEKVFPFAVPPSPQCTLDIKLNQKRKFAHELLGVNRIAMDDQHFAGARDPRILEILRQAPPLSIRFPGGTVGKWYDWKTDMWAFPDWANASQAIKRKRLFIYNGIKKHVRFGFDAYASICKEFAVTPILIFNVLYDSPQKNAARLKDRIARGMRPPWIELGNETYTEDGRGIGNIATIEDYIAVTKKIAKALRAVDPTVLLAVNTHASTYKKNTSDEWGTRLAKETYFDGVVIHPYTRFSPAYFFDETSRKNIFGGYGYMRSAIDNCRRQFPGKKVVLSEWGLLGESGGCRSFVSAISTAEHIFAIIKKWEEGAVAQASNHLYIGGSLGLYKTDPAHKKGSLRKTRKGVLYGLLWEAFRDSELYRALPQTPLIRDKYDERFDGIPAINARAIKASDGTIKIFCVNKLPKQGTLTIKIEGRKFSGKYKQLIYKESIIGDKDYALDEKPFTYKNGTGIVTLPSMSINMISLSQ